MSGRRLRRARRRDIAFATGDYAAPYDHARGTDLVRARSRSPCSVRCSPGSAARSGASSSRGTSSASSVTQETVLADARHRSPSGTRRFRAAAQATRRSTALSGIAAVALVATFAIGSSSTTALRARRADCCCSARRWRSACSRRCRGVDAVTVRGVLAVRSASRRRLLRMAAARLHIGVRGRRRAFVLVVAARRTRRPAFRRGRPLSYAAALGLRVAAGSIRSTGRAGSGSPPNRAGRVVRLSRACCCWTISRSAASRPRLNDKPCAAPRRSARSVVDRLLRAPASWGGDAERARRRRQRSPR